MKRIICLTVVLAFSLLLSACGEHIDEKHQKILEYLQKGKYEKAIAAIEKMRDDEAEGAFPWLDETNTSTSEEESTQDQLPNTPVCQHDFAVTAMQEADCERNGYIDAACKNCSETVHYTVEHYGHSFDGQGRCSRCGEYDPGSAAEKEKIYKEAVNNLRFGGWAWDPRYPDNYGANAQALELYNTFLQLGDYKDSAEYLSRFILVEDVLLGVRDTTYNSFGEIAYGGDIDPYHYDATGRQIALVRGLYINYWNYDTEGNLIGEISKSTNVTQTIATYTLDAQGRIARANYAFGDGSVQTIEYEYDSRGNLLLYGRIELYGDVTTVRCEYDADNNLIRQEDNRVTEYFYENGVLTRSICNGQETVYTVEDGRVVKKVIGNTVIEYIYGTYCRYVAPEK